MHEFLVSHGIKADTIDFVVHKGPFTYLDGEPSPGPNRFYASRNQIPTNLSSIVQGEMNTDSIQFRQFYKSLFEDVWNNTRLMRHLAYWKF